MEQALRLLSELQIKAMHKKISFNLDVEAGYHKDEPPKIILYLQSYERDKKGRYFQSVHLESSITADLSEDQINSRINAIEHFISTTISNND